MATYSSIKQAVATAANVARVVATNYDSIGSLPTSGNVLGEQALVIGDSSTDRLYIWEGSAWYQVALIQNSPTFTTSPDAAYELATDGVTTTVITLAATDPEGFPITFSATTNVGFDSIASVSQDSSVFTVTPFSQDSAGVSRSGTITFKASDGISVVSAISTFTITFKIVNSNYTSALIKASGNNGTNTTINDASSNNNSITVNGNAVAQAYTPYHPGGYSVYTGATDADFVKLDASTNYNFDNSGWQLEGWVYPIATDGGAAGIVEFYTDDNNTFRLFQQAGGFSVIGKISGTNYVNMGSTNGVQISLNEWNHFAVTWDGTQIRSYLNGLKISGSSTINTDITSTLGSQPLYLAQDYISTDRYMHGYMHDVRLQTGSGAVTYTGDYYDMPTAPLSTDSNTKFHLAALPYPADKKGGTVTFGGNAATERFGPYDYTSYNVSNHGASVYFDGNDDLRTTGYTGPIGTGDYTVECWAYITARNSSGAWLFQIQNGHAPSNANGIQVYYRNSSNQYKWAHLTNNTQYNTDTKSVLNTWHHVALTRASGTTRLFVDGVVIDTQTGDAYDASSYDDITIAKGYTDRALTGYISDFRVINGTALYTSAFTPPTTPLTAVTNTKYLTCNDTPNIYDTSGISNIQLNGDTKSSTAQTKNASSSITFDGSGDTITLDQQVPRNETDDWTIEFWTRPNNVTNRMDMFSQYDISTAGRMTINMNSSGILNFFQNGLSPSSISSSSSLSANTWHHVAVTNNSGTRSMWLDGNHQGTSTGSQAIMDSTIMIGNAVDRTDYMNGYMEDIRLTSGLARYPFIPAKETLEAITNTDLLIAHAATITDGSSNSIAVTANGDAAVSSFAPKYGMYSVAFDGTGDWLKTASSSNLNLYNTDFTIEGWIYASSPGASQHIWSSFIDGSNRESFYLSNSTTLTWWTNGSARINGTISANTWHHVAIVNNSNTTTMFIDGSKQGEWASSSYSDGNRLVWLGTYNDGGYGPDSFTGYISNIRLLRGTALYSNSFTAPTAELKA